MKQKIFIIFISIFLISCSEKEKDFDSFEYSYGGTFSTLFSIKFTDNDTVFMREHWNSGRYENGKFPKAKTNYFALLTIQQRNELSSILKKINFKKIDSEYFENYSDGSAFQLIIRKENFEKKVFVHSHKIPKELDSLASWINYTKINLKLTEINRELEFRSIEGILPPPPPPPPVEKILFIKK